VIASEGLPVEVACRVLGVSGAGFYAWRCRPLSARAVRHAWLTDLIREVHAAS
jgi:putative transposase